MANRKMTILMVLALLWAPFWPLTTSVRASSAGSGDLSLVGYVPATMGAEVRYSWARRGFRIRNTGNEPFTYQVAVLSTDGSVLSSELKTLRTLDGADFDHDGQGSVQVSVIAP